MQRAVTAVSEWWRTRVGFASRRGRPHRLFFVGERAGARLKVATIEMFTEEFISRVEAVFAADPLARRLGAGYLSACRTYKADIDRLKADLERARKGELVAKPKTYENRLQQATNRLAGEMAFLIDILPEYQVADLPVHPGDFFSLPYEGTTRRCEVLVTARERIHYRIDAVKLTRHMPLTEFLRRWGSDIVASPERGAREEYMGKTPGKASDTGRTLIREKYTECAANANSCGRSYRGGRVGSAEVARLGRLRHEPRPGRCSRLLVRRGPTTKVSPAGARGA